MHKRVVLGAINNISTTDSKKLREKNIQQKKEILEGCDSLLYAVGDLVDVQDVEESSETIEAKFVFLAPFLHPHSQHFLVLLS